MKRKKSRQENIDKLLVFLSKITKEQTNVKKQDGNGDKNTNN